MGAGGRKHKERLQQGSGGGLSACTSSEAWALSPLSSLHMPLFPLHFLLPPPNLHTCLCYCPCHARPSMRQKKSVLCFPAHACMAGITQQKENDMHFALHVALLHAEMGWAAASAHPPRPLPPGWWEDQSQNMLPTRKSMPFVSLCVVMQHALCGWFVDKTTASLCWKNHYCSYLPNTPHPK